MPSRNNSSNNNNFVPVIIVVIVAMLMVTMYLLGFSKGGQAGHVVFLLPQEVQNSRRGCARPAALSVCVGPCDVVVTGLAVLDFNYAYAI